jgi:hypothetical protein
LVTEHKDFGLEASSRLETSRNRAEQQADTLNHQDRSLAAIRLLSIPDWVFGREGQGAFWMPSAANAVSSPEPDGEPGSPRAAGSVESTGGAAASAGDPRRRNEPMLGRLAQLTRRPVLMGAVVLLAALLFAAAVTHALPASSLGSLAPAVLFFVIAANLLFSAIVGWLVYASLKSRFKSLRRSIHWRIGDLAEQAKQRADVEDQQAKLIISQLGQQAEAQEKIAEIIKRLKDGNGARDRDPP